jgi:hypothetical protein
MNGSQKVIFIFGPPAVGKMTVAQELARMTGFKLFHNHLTIECVMPVFDYGSAEFCMLVSDIRKRMFEEVTKSNLLGLVFTFVWALNRNYGHKLVEQWCDIFQSAGSLIYFVELEATLEERLKRNKTENRLLHKPSKRDLVMSEKIFLLNESEWIMNTTAALAYPFPYLRIDNTDLDAFQVAARICQTFRF